MPVDYRSPYLSVDENLRAAMACYSRSTPRGETRNYPGIALASSGVNFSVFNSVMLTGIVEDLTCLKRLLAVAALHFRERQLAWSSWICDDMLSGQAAARAAQALSELNMQLVAEAPGMIADQLAPPLREPAALDCLPVNDAPTRKAFCDIASIVFALPLRVSHSIYGEAAIWSGPMTGWVGYHEGRAVSIAATVAAAGSIGLYSIATLPNHQGKGYAETLIRQALAKARETTGLERTVLQTTRAGLNLYLRLGYRVVTRFRVHTKESCHSNW